MEPNGVFGISCNFEQSICISIVLHYGQSILEDKLIKQYKTHS